ncbi:hypothetical protein EZV62_020062 [Acer yangbiense]|uniref:Uncharacterized protein n=1 Tax=Acer yangbiense TaxID=1000413 RepID=A0A5C7HF36_9ROSI|nr:hypothetical protein EZV62_020062 [Acer yangbiense]
MEDNLAAKDCIRSYYRAYCHPATQKKIFSINYASVDDNLAVNVVEACPAFARASHSFQLLYADRLRQC